MNASPSLSPSEILSKHLTPAVAGYAERLVNAGFTVYVDERPHYVSARQTPPKMEGWFHYSRTVDGQECFGTYESEGVNNFGESGHTMPIKPSRLNGSGAIIGATWGDVDTFKIDSFAHDSVEYALAVARPSNWCPYSAEPTSEALEAEQRAYLSGRGAPQKFYKGATLQNATPWGIEAKTPVRRTPTPPTPTPTPTPTLTPTTTTKETS